MADGLVEWVMKIAQVRGRKIPGGVVKQRDGRGKVEVMGWCGVLLLCKCDKLVLLFFENHSRE